MSQPHNSPTTAVLSYRQHLTRQASQYHTDITNNQLSLVKRFEALYALEILLTRFSLDEFPITQEEIDSLRANLYEVSRRGITIETVIGDIGDYKEPTALPSPS